MQQEGVLSQQACAALRAAVDAQRTSSALACAPSIPRRACAAAHPTMFFGACLLQAPHKQTRSMPDQSTS